MKRTILSFGAIAGLVLILFVVSLIVLGHSAENEIVGYASMIIAFSFIYVAIRSFRDKHNQGVISFGKALKIGLGITLIGSTVYVVAWLIEYYVFIPDWMDKYTAHLIQEAKASGATGADLDKRIAEINKNGELYKSPIRMVLYTYLEVLPVGLIISLLASLILNRKTARPNPAFSSAS